MIETIFLVVVFAASVITIIRAGMDIDMWFCYRFVDRRYEEQARIESEKGGE